MKTSKQAAREAKHLFRFCIVNGTLDEDRARDAARRLAGAGHAGTLPVLSRFYRLVRLEQAKHSAEIKSATPLADDLRGQITSELQKTYGPGLALSFAEDRELLGGLRITVGSDRYDGSLKARLETLEARYSHG